MDRQRGDDLGRVGDAVALGQQLYPHELDRQTLEIGRLVIKACADAIQAQPNRLGVAFCDTVQRLMRCRGVIVAIGTGKSAHVAARFGADLATLGFRAAHAEATQLLHGGLGGLREDDVVVIFSRSGATIETNAAARGARTKGATVIAVTCEDGRGLAQLADIAVHVPVAFEDEVPEIPAASSAALSAVGDALALAAARSRRTTLVDVSMNHPAGLLGAILGTRVADHMRLSPLVPSVTPLSVACFAIISSGAPAALISMPSGLYVLPRASLEGIGRVEADVPVSSVMIPAAGTCSAESPLRGIWPLLEKSDLFWAVLDTAGQPIATLRQNDVQVPPLLE